MNANSLSDEELLALVGAFGHDVPSEHVNEVVSRGPQMEARLIQLLDDESTWMCAADDPECWMPVHLLLALGKSSSEEAGHAIARAVRTCAHLGSDELDWILPFWDALLRNKPASVSESFASTILDRTEHEAVRVAGTTIATAAAQRAGEAALAQCLATLARVAADETDSLTFRQYVASVLLDFPRPEYRSILERIADVRSSNGVLFAMPDVEYAYQQGQDTPEWERFTNPWEFYSEEAVEARYADEGFEDDPFDDDYGGEFIETYVRETPKIGRNEPCPCGSGKKYKKCCLQKSAPGVDPAMSSIDAVNRPHR